MLVLLQYVYEGACMFFSPLVTSFLVHKRVAELGDLTMNSKHSCTYLIETITIGSILLLVKTHIFYLIDVQDNLRFIKSEFAAQNYMIFIGDLKNCFGG